MTTSAACPESSCSPMSLICLRDMPFHRWPTRPPARPPTAAVAMIAGGNTRPSTAPTPMPVQAPCCVVFSRLCTWTLPSASRVTTAAS